MVAHAMLQVNANRRTRDDKTAWPRRHQLQFWAACISRMAAENDHSGVMESENENAAPEASVSPEAVRNAAREAALKRSQQVRTPTIPCLGKGSPRSAGAAMLHTTLVPPIVSSQGIASLRGCCHACAYLLSSLCDAPSGGAPQEPLLDSGAVENILQHVSMPT